MSRSLLAVLSLAVVAGCGGCKPPAPPRPRADAAVAARPDGGLRRDDPCDNLDPAQRELVVARVDDQVLTLCDFNRRMGHNNPYLRARFNAPEQRRALLQSWVDTELLAAEARARGLADEPEVRRFVSLQLARRLEAAVRAEVPPPAVSDDEVRAYYEAHRDEYVTEAQVRASQVVLRSRADAEQVLAEVKARPDDDALFRERARRLSVDLASHAADGDMGFFPRAGNGNVVPEVAAAAFALQRNGQIADAVVESAHGGQNHGPGFHVVRLTARRDAIRRTLEEESRRIRARLSREKRERAEEEAMRAVVERVRAATPVQVDEAALAAVRVEPAPGVQPAMQGPVPTLPGPLPPGLPTAPAAPVRAP